MTTKRLPGWTLRRAHARVRAREKSLKNFDPVPNFRETIFFLAVSQTRTSGSALGLVAAAYSSVTRIAFSAAASLKNERARLQPAPHRSKSILYLLQTIPSVTWPHRA